jgi:hypothetical protein
MEVQMYEIARRDLALLPPIFCCCAMLQSLNVGSYARYTAERQQAYCNREHVSGNTPARAVSVEPQYRTPHQLTVVADFCDVVCMTVLIAPIMNAHLVDTPQSEECTLSLPSTYNSRARQNIARNKAEVPCDG